MGNGFAHSSPLPYLPNELYAAYIFPMATDGYRRQWTLAILSVVCTQWHDVVLGHSPILRRPTLHGYGALTIVSQFSRLRALCLPSLESQCTRRLPELCPRILSLDVAGSHTWENADVARFTCLEYLRIGNTRDYKCDRLNEDAFCHLTTLRHLTVVQPSLISASIAVKLPRLESFTGIPNVYSFTSHMLSTSNQGATASVWINHDIANVSLPSSFTKLTFAPSDVMINNYTPRRDDACISVCTIWNPPTVSVFVFIRSIMITRGITLFDAPRIDLSKWFPNLESLQLAQMHNIRPLN